MNTFIVVAVGAVIAYTIVTSWPDIVRYHRMMAM